MRSSAKYKMKSWVTRTVSGAVLLSIIGSAAWDIGKPYASSVGNVVLSILTLGIASLRDDIYVEVARGSYERFGPLVYLALFVFVVNGVLVGLALASARIDRFAEKWRRRIDALSAELDADGGPPKTDDGDVVTVEDLKLRTHEISLKVNDAARFMRRGLRYISLITAALFLLLIAQGIQTSYENRAARLLEQLQTIDAPFIEQPRRLELASSAAQIRSRDDYVKLLTELQDIATKNGARIPSFSVW